MRFIPCVFIIHTFRFVSSNISSVMPGKIHKITQNLNRFFSVWAPDLLRQSRLQRICLWTLWTVARFDRQLGETAVVVNFRGLHHLGNCDKLPSKPIHVSTLEKIGPDPPTSLCMFHCIHMWGFVGIYGDFFSRKVHCFEFRAGASSADWSWIKGATCSAPLNASTWITSGTTWDSDVPTCEATKMQKKQRHLSMSWHPRGAEKHSSEHRETCLKLLEVLQVWLHHLDTKDSSFALESI